MKQTKIETEVAWTRVRASKAPYDDIDGRRAMLCRPGY